MFHWSRWAGILLLALLWASAALATPPIAPSNLCAVTSSNAFYLIYQDNSTDETAFEVDYTINGGNVGTFSVNTASAAGTGFTSISLNPLAVGTAYTFKIAALKNSEVSAFTNTINVNDGAFNAPSNLGASVQTNGAIMLTWVDNSTAEGGYLIEHRTLPNGTFTTAGYTNSDGYSVTLDKLWGLAPSANFEFRVRGFQGTYGNPTAYTAYCATISASTPALSAPSSLAIVAVDETSLKFTIQGTSANNTGYEIESGTAGQNSFTYLGDAQDSSQSPYLFTVNAQNLFSSGTAYDFRVRAYYEDSAKNRVYSGYSSIASGTTPFYAPTNLVATPSSTSPYQISFTWADNSSAETGYELQYRKQNLASPQAFVSRKTTAANTTSISNLPEFDPGSIYEFRLRAVNSTANTYSAFYPASGGVVATTKNGFTSKPYAPITSGSAFSYQLSTLSQSTRANWSVGTLPSGLSFDNASGVISGTVTTAGVYTVPMTANFADGSSHTLPLTLRCIRPPAPPQITVAIPSQTLTQSGSTAIALDTKFADPDTESAMRMVTSKGNLDIILYSTATPQTVANFLGYVNRGDYANTYFHRAPANFVMQGGGYKLYSAPDTFQHITTVAPVANEPGVSNVAGTIAMAKVADNPDSATSEFFFNSADNSANLDAQDGGFTVFGRVSTPSLQGALASLKAIPVGNYNVNIYTTSGTTATTFSDLPIDTDGAPPSVTSITPLPVLTYAVTTTPNSAVATAALSGSSLQINAVASGSTTLTVSATDVDGNATSQSFGITVQQTLAQWAAAQGRTGAQTASTADPDHNGLTNLHEFAFMANPATATSAQLPTMKLTPVAQIQYAEITFPVRKFAAGLTYAVEASSTLASNDWTPLWTSTDGFTAPVVSSAVDQADRTVVTVRDTQALSGAARRFLRVKLIGQ